MNFSQTLVSRGYFKKGQVQNPAPLHKQMTNTLGKIFLLDKRDTYKVASPGFQLAGQFSPVCRAFRTRKVSSTLRPTLRS